MRFFKLKTEASWSIPCRINDDLVEQKREKNGYLFIFTKPKKTLIANQGFFFASWVRAVVIDGPEQRKLGFSLLFDDSRSWKSQLFFETIVSALRVIFCWSVQRNHFLLKVILFLSKDWLECHSVRGRYAPSIYCECLCFGKCWWAGIRHFLETVVLRGPPKLRLDDFEPINSKRLVCTWTPHDPELYKFRPNNESIH